jgi:hypothetical protein
MEFKMAASEISPLGEHKFIFVKKEFTLFGHVNHIGPDEKLQGILPVVTPGEHPPEYGLGFNLQLFYGLGSIGCGGIVLPEGLNYLGYCAHYQPVGQKKCRQDKKNDYQNDKQYALQIHKQFTPIYYYTKFVLLMLIVCASCPPAG